MRFLLSLLLLLPASVYAASVVNLETLPLTASTVKTAEEIRLGSEILRGVRAEATLEPLAESSAANYRLRVTFSRVQNGEKLNEGQAAARVYGTGDKSLETVRLEFAQERWDCELQLPVEGESMIKVGSQLADGKKRIYRFFFTPVPPAG